MPFPQHFEVGATRVPIVYSGRRKTVALKEKQQHIQLEIPKTLSCHQVKHLLQQHQDWLVARAGAMQQQLQLQLQQHPAPFTGQNQDNFSFLGQTYQCVWQTGAKHLLFSAQQQSISNGVQVKLEPSTLRLNCLAPNAKVLTSKIVYQALQGIFKDEAQHYLERQTKAYAQTMGVTYQSVQIKSYRARWGSCYADGRIQFNWRLMQAPTWVIDYVVVHELAHRLHLNHSPAFWQCVAHYYPAMQAAKTMLKQHGKHWIQFLR